MDKFLDLVSRESPELYSHMVDESGQLTFLGCLAYVQLVLAVANVIARISIDLIRDEVAKSGG